MPAFLHFDGDCLIVLRKTFSAVTPFEGCALLLGNKNYHSNFEEKPGWNVSFIWPCCNVWKPGSLPEHNHSSKKLKNFEKSFSRKNRFVLDPREQIHAQRWGRKNNLEVLGSAHSHPAGEAIPSITDQLCAIPPSLMVIMGKSGSVRSWWITGQKHNQKSELPTLGS